MDRQRLRAAPLALIGLVLAACTTASSPAGSSGAEASAAASATSAAPSAAASTPADASAASATAYACAELISDGEMQGATGLSGAALFAEEHWTDTAGMPEGQTYCQFFTGDANISIAVSILTGASYESMYVVLVSVGGGEALPGIGDAAVLAPDGSAGAANTHGVGITVIFTDMGGGAGLRSADGKAALTQILNLIVDRV